MEPAAAWGPSCEFQLANWTIEEPAVEDWAPAVGLPLEYASSDMFGTGCSLQTYVPESIGGQQLVEYNYSAASRHNWSPEAIVVDGMNQHEVVDPQKMETRNAVSNDSYATNVFGEVEHSFTVDIDLIKVKMHKYPVGFQNDIYKSYLMPRVVAIGPYHHNQPHLKQAEKAKHMAVIIIVKESGHLLEDIYAAVATAAKDARRLYDKDSIEGISCTDFNDMMFVDACFLVQYMRMECEKSKDQSLRGFLGPNGRDIRRDLILLENQLPWKVVETVMNCFMPVDVPLNEFISGWKGYMQHRRKKELKKEKDDAYVSTLVTDKRFKPHLLGLLRYYIVGGTSGKDTRKPKRKSISVSANELAEIGISLTANKTMKLMDMGLKREGTLLAELSLAPLSLDPNRACLLINMAALELCTVKSFSQVQVEESAVCSYLQLLALLVCREEDVQELRVRGLLQGGGGLTDEENCTTMSCLRSRITRRAAGGRPRSTHFITETRKPLQQLSQASVHLLGS